MTALRLLAEIAIRTTAIAVAAELVTRVLILDSRHRRRVWIAACVATLAVALSTSIDLLPRVPHAVVARSMATIGMESRDQPANVQPWLTARYRRPRYDAAAIVRTAWIAGVIGITAWIAASWLAIRRLRKHATAVSPCIAAIARDLHAPRRCSIMTACVVAPCTTGLLVPTILLPFEAAQWPAAKVRAALAHELTHVRQHDTLWAAMTWAACAAVWFTPAIWMIRSRLQASCEFTSDEAAAMLSGGARTYARALTEVAESALHHRLKMVTSMAGGASIAARVDRLLGTPPSRNIRRSIVAALLLPPLLAVAASRLDARTPLTAAPAARNLLSELRSPSADVRASAIYRLARWQDRDEEVLPVLIRHLGDDAPLTTLPRWNFTRDGWAPARHVFVLSSPGEVAAIGAASLGAMAAESLVTQLSNPNPVVRRNAAWALGELRHPREIKRMQRAALIRALGDSEPTVRAAAAWTLGDLGASEAAEPLRAMLAREHNPFARAEAANALRAAERGISLEFFRHPD